MSMSHMPQNPQFSELTSSLLNASRESIKIHWWFQNLNPVQIFNYFIIEMGENKTCMNAKTMRRGPVTKNRIQPKKDT